MRVSILTPTAFPSISGNAVTAERWRRGLTKRGITVNVLACDGLDLSAFQEHLQQYSPDLIHVHHAFRSGALLLNPLLARWLSDLAVVVSPGGTDINKDLETPERRETVLSVFKLARAIVAQSPEAIKRLKYHLPSLTERIVYVPRAVCWFGDEPYDLRRTAECTPEDILFFLPSGIRPVKGNIECLKAMSRVYEIRPRIRFVAAGPSVDNEYSNSFRREVAAHSAFALWVKTIPSAAMQSAYQSSDIVLNASFSEGLSNSLIEAIAAGRPVLASDIPENRWPVLGDNGDAPAGLLYDLHRPEDFILKALKLIDDEALRESLSLAAFSRKSKWPDDEEEAAGLIAAYRVALN
jgi:L-malate glycosyltransferase